MKAIIKDCLILFVITLIAGAALGVVYDVTKAPIAAQEAKKKEEAQKGVFADADSFDSIELDDAVLAEVQTNGVTIDEAYDAVAGGAHAGYVIQATSPNGYGGDITLMVGVTADGTCNGYSLLTIAETAGLGMRAKEPNFYNQFAGQQAEKFYVSKDGGDGQPIDALSGATITSRAVTGAVNTALGYYQTALGGSGNE